MPTHYPTIDNQESLLGILAQLRDLQAQPLVPDNPLAQIGTVLSGFASGVQGQPNPALQMFRQQRADQMEGLKTQSGMMGLQVQLDREKRLETQNKSKIAAQLGLELLKSDEGRSFGIRLLKESGLVNVPDEILQDYAKTPSAKSLSERLPLILGALDAGIDPASIGISTQGVDVKALQALPNRDALLPAKDRASLATVAEKNAKTKLEGLKAEAIDRVRQGTATIEDRRLAGVAPASPEGVLADILTNYYAGKPLSSSQQQAVQGYLTAQQLKGLTGDAQLAIRAATGDESAKKALALLSPAEKNITEATILLKAGEIRAKQQGNPTYRPTLPEQGMLIAADDLLERKHTKPLRQDQEKDFLALRAMGQQLAVIKGIKNPQQYLGRITGPVGQKFEEWGITHYPDRAKLLAALDVLFAEVGPQKFGGQFTEPEQGIVRAFMAEIKNPSGLFTVRFNALTNMLEQKHRDRLALAKAGKFRVPDEFQSMYPSDTTSDPAREKTKQRIKDLLLDGKTLEEAKAIVGARP